MFGRSGIDSIPDTQSAAFITLLHNSIDPSGLVKHINWTTYSCSCFDNFYGRNNAHCRPSLIEVVNIVLFSAMLLYCLLYARVGLPLYCIPMRLIVTDT